MRLIVHKSLGCLLAREQVREFLIIKADQADFEAFFPERCQFQPQKVFVPAGTTDRKLIIRNR